MRSRRKFLKLVALATAASVAPNIAPPRARGATPAKPRLEAPARSPKLAAEIARQKKTTADQLGTIRSFPLPAGSEMACVFTPMPAARRRATAAKPSTASRRAGR